LAHFPFIIWNCQVMSEKEWKIGQIFVAFSKNLNFRLMTCCFWLSCAIRMWSGCTWIKLSCFSKVFGIIWSYGNTGYKVFNLGIQNRIFRIFWSGMLQIDFDWNSFVKKHVLKRNHTYRRVASTNASY